MSNNAENQAGAPPSFEEKLSEINDLSFEQAMERLEGVVNDLERGNISLDKSLKAYEYGMALKSYCADRLKKAEQKIEKIMTDSDGKIKKVPLDNE
jgi:exodeoxyribonuclease VII small subunit